ncbi:MAG: site-specific DNA-methyltransferase, partial [Planctomycetota bacterium]
MNKTAPYGPHNPHPLSTLKTELVWEGKYDEYGRRREVDVAGCAMPMQRIETIDQPRSEAAAAGAQSLLQFEKKTTRVDDFRNRLIWGDNKLVMASLLAEFKGKIDLIYIDPPFDVGADFTMPVPTGESGSVQKDQSALEMVAYRDTWGRGRDSYLSTMHDRAQVMGSLLAPGGSVFVHLAPIVSHHMKCVLDDALGAENFRNEIIVHRPITKNLQRQFETIEALPQGHDVILWYSSRPDSRFPNLLVPYEAKHPEGYWHRFWSGADRPTMRYELLGETITHGQWKWSKDRALIAVANYKTFLKEANGRSLVAYWRDTGGELEFIRKSATGAVENWFAPSDDKVADTVWDDVKAYENEKDYPTQKSTDLLTRIIEWASPAGGLVADFFCGSGTTGAVAEKLGRRWIMADLGRFAIHTTRKRLIDVQRTLSAEGKPYRSFDVHNLGRYERQWWQQEALKGADTEHRRVVLEFFRAEVLDKAPSALLHGRKNGAFCHVDGIDSIFTRSEAVALAKAAAAAGGKECYCLAWEFEMDLRLTTAALEKDPGVKLKLIQIPREIMERNRKDPPPFLEMAVLEAEPVYRRAHAKAQSSQSGAHAKAQSSLKESHAEAQSPQREKGLCASAPLRELSPVDIKLTKFMPSLAEVPSKELEALKERAVKSGFDFIDFWAVDFDWQPGKPFNHHWQDYRTRKDRTLKTVSDAHYHEYPRPGTYR